MRRNVYFVFVVILTAVLLAACTGTATPAAQPTQAQQQAASSNQAAQPAGCLGKAEGAIVDLKCQEITIAVENAYLPFNYILVKDNKPGGWDYDTWTELCTRLHCTPKYVEVAWDGMIQSVSNKQYDVAADGITITEERQKIVDFSMGYIKIQQRLLVRKGEKRFDGIEAFAKDDKLIMGAQANTTNYETAKKTIAENRLKAFEQMPFAVQALLSGDVDAVIMDEVVGMGYQGENGTKLELVGASISSDQLGFVFPKGSALLAPVNKALQSVIDDGTLAKINAKYFGSDFKVTNSDIKGGN